MAGEKIIFLNLKTKKHPGCITPGGVVGIVQSETIFHDDWFLAIGGEEKPTRALLNHWQNGD